MISGDKSHCHLTPEKSYSLSLLMKLSALKWVENVKLVKLYRIKSLLLEIYHSTPVEIPTALGAPRIHILLFSHSQISPTVPLNHFRLHNNSRKLYVGCLHSFIIPWLNAWNSLRIFYLFISIRKKRLEPSEGENWWRAGQREKNINKA